MLIVVNLSCNLLAKECQTTIGISSLDLFRCRLTWWRWLLPITTQLKPIHRTLLGISPSTPALRLEIRPSSWPVQSQSPVNINWQYLFPPQNFSLQGMPVKLVPRYWRFTKITFKCPIRCQSKIWLPFQISQPVQWKIGVLLHTGLPF